VDNDRWSVNSDWEDTAVPKYHVHSVDARHFPKEGYYLFQATMDVNPKVVVTLKVKEDPGRRVMDDLINKGGPVEVDMDHTDAVEAHVIP
jgi:hypothetical protein